MIKSSFSNRQGGECVVPMVEAAAVRVIPVPPKRLMRKASRVESSSESNPVLVAPFEVHLRLLSSDISYRISGVFFIVSCGGGLSWYQTALNFELHATNR